MSTLLSPKLSPDTVKQVDQYVQEEARLIKKGPAGSAYESYKEAVLRLEQTPVATRHVGIRRVLHAATTIADAIGAKPELSKTIRDEVQRKTEAARSETAGNRPGSGGGRY